MEKEKNSNLGRNGEFGFLYKKLSIRPYVISLIELVPEYMDALKSSKAPLNDKTVYEIIKNTYIQMYNNGEDSKTSRNILNKISQDVMGSSHAWQNDISQGCEIKNNYGFLFKKSALPKVDLNSLLNHMESFRAEADLIMEKGKGIEDIDIYKITEKLYFPKLKSGERSGEARRLNKALRHFSETLFDDVKAWKKDYSDYLLSTDE